MIEVKIGGDMDSLKQLLADTPKIAQRAYDGRVNAKLNEIRRKLTRYPSPPANSTYRRTFKLRDGWGGAADRSGPFERTLANDTPYAKWVQARDTQARIHQGRWATVEDVLDEVDIDDLADEVASDIARALGGRG